MLCFLLPLFFPFHVGVDALGFFSTAQRIIGHRKKKGLKTDAVVDSRKSWFNSHVLFSFFSRWSIGTTWGCSGHFVNGLKQLVMQIKGSRLHFFRHPTQRPHTGQSQKARWLPSSPDQSNILLWTDHPLRFPPTLLRHWIPRSWFIYLRFELYVKTGEIRREWGRRTSGKKKKKKRGEWDKTKKGRKKTRETTLHIHSSGLPYIKASILIREKADQASMHLVKLRIVIPKGFVENP